MAMTSTTTISLAVLGSPAHDGPSRGLSLVAPHSATNIVTSGGSQLANTSVTAPAASSSRRYSCLRWSSWGSFKRRSGTLITILLGIIVLPTAWMAFRLASWTSAKDWMQYCNSLNISRIITGPCWRKIHYASPPTTLLTPPPYSDGWFRGPSQKRAIADMPSDSETIWHIDVNVPYSVVAIIAAIILSYVVFRAYLALRRYCSGTFNGNKHQSVDSGVQPSTYDLHPHPAEPLPWVSSTVPRTRVTLSSIHVIASGDVRNRFNNSTAANTTTITPMEHFDSDWIPVSIGNEEFGTPPVIYPGRSSVGFSITNDESDGGSSDESDDQPVDDSDDEFIDLGFIVNSMSPSKSLYKAAWQSYMMEAFTENIESHPQSYHLCYHSLERNYTSRVYGSCKSLIHHLLREHSDIAWPSHLKEGGRRRRTLS